MKRALANRLTLFTAVALLASAPLSLGAQADFTIEDILSPLFPVEMVSANAADRIAWIAFERGMRNVYTAATPDFEPMRLTRWMADDGTDLTDIRISDDGEVVVFVRGHFPNRVGWVANPSSDPQGGEEAIWAAGTRGGDPWRVVEGSDPVLSPDGRWVLYVKEGQIYRASVDPGTAVEDADDSPPLFRAWGENGEPVWSPDGRRIAFVSEREDHSFIGIYDTERPAVTYLAPGVDRDDQPVWSPDGSHVAFVRQPGLPFGSRAERPRSVPDSLIPEGIQEARFAGGYDLSIWVADVATGKGEEVWHNPPSGSGINNLRNLMWGGEHLLFEAEPGNWRHFFSVRASGHDGAPIELTPGDGLTEHVSLSADGKTLYYATNVGDIDRRHLWKVSTAGGRARQLTHGESIVTYPAVLASEEGVAVLVAGPRLPQSVGVVSSGGGEARVITPLPDRFPFDAQVGPEAVTLTAEDGFEFYNQLFLPPDLRRGE
ncbi:MAG: PD40 domain-containing protein, partial [Gemmatimonadetes bacterium]|nr:PD40 domain-containing protein [Gemmatimonadota bacterium]